MRCTTHSPSFGGVRPGSKPLAISILWSEAVAAEVVVFFLIGPALLDRLGARAAAIVAAAAGIVRWSVAGMTTSVLALSIIQPLHGFTFALLHLASMRMMQTLVPARLAGTAQSIYAFGSGCLTAVLTLLSGILYGQVWRNGIPSDGHSMCRRTPACVARFR